MRDIRSPRPSKPSNDPKSAKPEQNHGGELYESSANNKDKKNYEEAVNKPPLKKESGQAAGMPEVVEPTPKKPFASRSHDKQTPSRNNAGNQQAKKPPEAKVPITNVHIPESDLHTHSDADHVEEKKAVKKPETKPDIKPERPLFAKTPLKKSPPKKKVKSRIGHKERKIVVGLFFMAVTAVLLAGFLFLPKADVYLVLRNAPLLIDEKLIIRAQDTTADDVIPGTAFFREIRIEAESPVTSTEIVGTKATGTVQIVNRTIEEQQIMENSRLVTEDGTLFYMERHAIVPPASGGTPSRVSVAIVAAEDGEQGNIEPQRLDFAALDSSSQSVVYAEATQALTGGTGEEVLVVKGDDIDEARKQAKEEAVKQAEQEIRGELPEDWVILEESWTAEITSFETSVNIDDEAEEISYEANIAVHVMGFEEEKLEETLKRSLEQRLDDNFMLFPGQISFTQSIDSVDWESAEAIVSTRVTHTTVPKLSLETLQERIAGRSQAEAVSYLEGLPGVHEVNIDLWPFWVNSIPRIEQRVSIEVEPERKP